MKSSRAMSLDIMKDRITNKCAKCSDKLGELINEKCSASELISGRENAGTSDDVIWYKIP